MTAKIDLIAKLTALMPEGAREIIKILREYLAYRRRAAFDG